MVIWFLIVAQIGNIYIAYRVTKKSFSYLVLCNSILLLNLIGSIINEIEKYDTHEASTYIVAFGFLLSAGAFLQNLLINKRLRKAMNFEMRSANSAYNELNAKVIMYALLLFFVAAIYFYASYGMPLFFEDLKYARRDVQKDAHLFYRIFLYFIPISSAMLYVRYKIYNNKTDRNLFVVFFCVTALLLLSLGFKGYVLWYVVFIIMLMNVYSDDVFKYALMLAVVGLLSGVVATSFMHSSDASESMDLLLMRSTQIAAYGYNMVFYELYPQLSFLSIGDSNINRFLAEWKFGKDDNMAVHSMGITITIVGALLVYLGKAGVLLAAITLGFLLQYVYFLAFKYRVSPLFGVFYLYLTFVFVGLVTRGTLQTVLSQPVLSLLLLMVFYVVLQATLKGDGKYVFNRVKY
ncbi:oligosaccharide repeat unit polymerase [Thiohalomonas denitrificans]|uniref:Oligosaccharide repeat unit polymerase n=1 Tax=Thiohalomonas denitrificans TaxID=415747 RepID=A0A1G5QZV0_9GAMM|nr:oligosaccharide repeat unit polymerase [Thiohalomonas denitrificans]SCZ67302.1 hypothetical protein SAMN03097708_03121 [Thiohalomonas denitrificans]